ncbi:MAG: ribosome silencing factor [Elusimicrobia bacterium CG1_02_56_21]|nr:MAG: ribosome silencing factor [Elusimicrobia bacterium CG1_02_56_21]
MTISKNGFKKIAIEAALAGDSKKARPVTVFDLVGKSPVADYAVLLVADSPPQMDAIEQEVQVRLKHRGVYCLHKDGSNSKNWKVLDYGGVLVHIYDRKEAEFYAIDKVYDAYKTVEWGEPKAPKAAAPAIKAAPEEKAPAKKAAAVKPAAKKTAAKKPAAKKPAVKKLAAKKPAVKKTAAKKTALGKAAGRKKAVKKVLTLKASKKKTSPGKALKKAKPAKKVIAKKAKPAKKAAPVKKAGKNSRKK